MKSYQWSIMNEKRNRSIRSALSDNWFSLLTPSSRFFLYLIFFSFYISFSNSLILNNQVQQSRRLNSFRSYKDAQLFRYQIPRETKIAVFRLNASQSDSSINVNQFVKSSWNFTQSNWSNSSITTYSKTNISFFNINTTMITTYGKKVEKFYQSLLAKTCKKPLDVTFYIRWGSIPLVQIKNASTPENFIFDNKTQFRIDLKTNEKLVLFNITNPLPGDWYGMAFLNRVNDKISQKGLERECFYRLFSSLSLQDRASSVTVLTPSHTISLKQTLVIGYQDNLPELLYKFTLNTKEHGGKIVIKHCQYRPSTNVRHVMNPSSVINSASIDVGSTIQNFSSISCPIKLNFRTLALPNDSTNDFSINCSSSNTNVDSSRNINKCVVDLSTYAPHEWNYLQIQPNLPIELDRNSRSKISGSIDFTIQLLAGQDAFLYNYFNDQQCQTTTIQNESTTLVSPLTSTLNFARTKEENMINPLFTTATSYFVALPKIDSVSSKTDNNLRKTEDNSIIELRQPKSNINDQIHSVSLTEESSKKTIFTKTDTSIDFNNEDKLIETLNRNSLSKRFAVDQQPTKERKKTDKKKEERRSKKQKNRNRQKNREKLEEQCQFEPSKILNTLDEDDLSNMTTFNVVNMVRVTDSDSFDFRYINFEKTLDSSNLQNLSLPSEIVIDNDRPSLLNFTVFSQNDIGGNLAIEFSIFPSTNNSLQNVSALLCLTHNKLPPVLAMEINVETDCYGYLVSNTSNVNFSTKSSTLQGMTIPYPQPGTWFVSIFIKCYSENDEVSQDLNQIFNADYSCDYSNKTSVAINIQSSACYESRCLNGGKCLQLFNGGISYSTCSCRAGWKGWICNDGSEALSQEKLLQNFLFLTVSNAAFLPAIILAIFRHYFTESAIYFITMISSTLYHACDSDYSQSYCAFSLSLLQFADFYSAILSFFVTLITLAYVSLACKSFYHLLGAILIAMITQNDRTSLWTFVIPAGLGTILLFMCWCSRCCRKNCYPPVRCWFISVFPSLILTIVGLVIYAFFETQENYAITHSIWHIIVAIALFLAILSMPPTTPIDNEEEEERTHFMSSSSSSGAGSGKGTAKSNPETYYELIGEEGSHLARNHPQSVSSNAQHITKTY